MLGLGGVVLKLKILTFYVWDLVWFEVDNLDVLCWDLAVRFAVAD